MNERTIKDVIAAIIEAEEEFLHGINLSPGQLANISFEVEITEDGKMIVKKIDVPKDIQSPHFD